MKQMAEVVAITFSSPALTVEFSPVLLMVDPLHEVFPKLHGPFLPRYPALEFPLNLRDSPVLRLKLISHSTMYGSLNAGNWIATRRP